MTTLLIPLVPADAAAAPALQRRLPASANGAASADGLAVRATALSAWVRAVREAHDPALLLEPQGLVVASSVPGADLLGRAVADLVGRPLADAADFVDFRSSPRPVDPGTPRLVPLRVLRTGTPGRGLVRFRRDDVTVTCDVVASALHDSAGGLVGALVMLAPVPA